MKNTLVSLLGIILAIVIVSYILAGTWNLTFAVWFGLPEYGLSGGLALLILLVIIFGVIGGVRSGSRRCDCGDVR